MIFSTISTTLFLMKLMPLVESRKNNKYIKKVNIPEKYILEDIDDLEKSNHEKHVRDISILFGNFFIIKILFCIKNTIDINTIFSFIGT